ncbi:hypothetical protein DMX08_23795 [Pseudomonas protegens]|uniref:Uncharacterized protein n=1 Tax=Pseudomonas protegens TaxID=380021 RepID=A0A9Q6ICM9_9PSED|nr:hypothetical protein DMX08_23795 [Pseudomonas protegens]
MPYKSKRKSAIRGKLYRIPVAAAAGCDKARRAFRGPQGRRPLRGRSQPAAAATRSGVAGHLQHLGFALTFPGLRPAVRRICHQEYLDAQPRFYLGPTLAQISALCRAIGYCHGAGAGGGGA